MKKILAAYFIALASVTMGAENYQSCWPQKNTCNFECVRIDVPNSMTVEMRECPTKSTKAWGVMANLDTIPAPVKPDTSKFPLLK